MATSATSNVLSLMLLGGVLVATAWMIRRRSRDTTHTSRTKRMVSDEMEEQLAQDLSYNESVAAETFTFHRRKLSVTDEGRPILVIGVCGGSGSGKTTLSRAIMRDFGVDRVSYLSHDYYYKDLGNMTMEQRSEHNFDHPDSLDTALLVKHLAMLREGKSAEIPMYDFATHSRCKETTLMKPASVILVEGILIFADPKLVELMDIKIYVETAADIRLLRRLRRDMVERGRSAESVMKQYMKTVRPMHMMFVESSKRVADIIIPQGVNTVALDMIISRLHSFVASQAMGDSDDSECSRKSSQETDEDDTTTPRRPPLGNLESK